MMLCSQLLYSWLQPMYLWVPWCWVLCGSQQLLVAGIQQGLQALSKAWFALLVASTDAARFGARCILSEVLAHPTSLFQHWIPSLAPLGSHARLGPVPTARVCDRVSWAPLSALASSLFPCCPLCPSRWSLLLLVFVELSRAGTCWCLRKGSSPTRAARLRSVQKWGVLTSSKEKMGVRNHSEPNVYLLQVKQNHQLSSQLL